MGPGVCKQEQAAYGRGADAHGGGGSRAQAISGYPKDPCLRPRHRCPVRRPGTHRSTQGRTKDDRGPPLAGGKRSRPEGPPWDLAKVSGTTLQSAEHESHGSSGESDPEVSATAGPWDPVPRVHWQPAPTTRPPRAQQSPPHAATDTGTRSRPGPSGNPRGAHATRPVGCGLPWPSCLRTHSSSFSKNTAWEEGRGGGGEEAGAQGHRRGSKAGQGWNRCRKGKAGGAGDSPEKVSPG